MAASLCKKNEVSPRAIFPTYFEELKKLMEQGISKSDLPNNQMYNQGETLGPKQMSDEIIWICFLCLISFSAVSEDRRYDV
mgnify:CR=1 FL=1